MIEIVKTYTGIKYHLSKDNSFTLCHIEVYSTKTNLNLYKRELEKKVCKKCLLNFTKGDYYNE